MKNAIHLLGTGSSLGVPVVACSCPVCHSTSTKNHRLRCSALLKIDGKQILIDPGPDVRQQFLRAEIKHLDGVILTHLHHDHSAGADDLRVFAFMTRKKLPFLLSESSCEELKQRFHYLTDKFDFISLTEERGEVAFQEIPIRYFTYKQMGVGVLGLRIRSLAYVTDIKEYDNQIIEELQGLDILILSALRKSPSAPGHLSIEDAIDFTLKLEAKKTYLIHLAHEVDHDTVNQELPENVELGYDGLEIPF
jgi:phosphoribosyl 1,2-cyclic phosphate phosphodiesterase